MQQLDLFGNPIEKKPEVKNPLSKDVVKADEVYINQAVALAENFEPPPAAITAETFEEAKPTEFKSPQINLAEIPSVNTGSPIIFSNGKIGVKIKPKSSPVKATEATAPTRIAKTIKPEQKRGRKSFKEMDAEVDLIEVPDDEILFQKQYYAISQVAEWFKVNTSLIRFWENEFDVLKPKKNRKGDRLFRPEDVKNLHLIYHLLRQRKYTIDGAKEYMKTNKGQADLQMKLTNSLQKVKSFLLDLKANLH